MSSNRIGQVWFNGRETVGIVLAHDTVTDKLKAWIRPVPGGESSADLQAIMEYGSKFPTAEAISLINNHGSWNLNTMEEIVAMTEKQGEW